MIKRQADPWLPRHTKFVGWACGAITQKGRIFRQPGDGHLHSTLRAERSNPQIKEEWIASSLRSSQ
jgi:hypothetical protein